MLRIFSSINGQVEQIEKPENGSWLCLSSEPTDVELATVSSETGIDLADLRAPLDDEERSRVDVEDDYTMIIVDIPTVEERGGRDWYETIPLSIIVTETLIITVCMQDTPVLHPFMEGTIRGFNTFMRSRFILQILYRNATMYLRYLRIIDRESDKLELKLRHSMQNREIVMLLELSKTLVYFTTSLKSNEIVMEKLTTLQRIKQYPDDEDLLDDVITENKQAIEMANIYSGVLANMTDAFASIVSNNLNNVMRIFTIISITLSIPTLIFSMYGMNFDGGMMGMPFTDKPWGFMLIIVISMVLSGRLPGSSHVRACSSKAFTMTTGKSAIRGRAPHARDYLWPDSPARAALSVCRLVTEGAAQGPTIAIGVAADQPWVGYIAWRRILRFRHRRGQIRGRKPSDMRKSRSCSNRCPPPCEPPRSPMARWTWSWIPSPWTGSTMVSADRRRTISDGPGGAAHPLR